MDQAELDKSMKQLELVENDVSYVVALSYLPVIVLPLLSREPLILVHTD